MTAHTAVKPACRQELTAPALPPSSSRGIGQRADSALYISPRLSGEGEGVRDQATFCTGERRYSKTLRVPRWISALTCMPGEEAKSNREQPGPSPIEVSVLILERRIHGEVTTTVLLVPRRVKPPLENKRSS